MSPRLQRLLLILLMVYFCLIGGTFYTERSAVLRIVHQVLTMLVLAGWLITLWRERRGFPATPLDRPLLATGLVWLLSALFALDRRVSLEYTWPILVNILAYYLLTDLMRRGRQRWVMEALFTVGAVVVLLSGIEAVSWYFGLPLSPDFVVSWPQVGAGLFPPIWHRLALALNVSTLLGCFTASLIPITAAWALTARQRDLRVGLWLLAAALTATLLLTQSRGAQMALATSSGLLILTWLLRPAVRQRFPRPLRLVLDPRLLIGATVLAGAALVVFVFASTLRSPLRSGDENRLDLWQSALEMAADHPLLGARPYQYGLQLRYYGDPDLALAQDRLVTAHNLPLHTLAEGGLAGVAVALWLGAAFARAWWRAWRAASPGRRRRLEGGLAALLGFGVQSLVDTFTLTALLLPLIVFAAYTVAGQVTRAQAVAEPRPSATRRWPVGAALALLAAIQIIYLPVHAGNLAHDRAQRALGLNDFAAALDETRAAHAADPSLHLYPLQEAFILGRMAQTDPDHSLELAIAAHETAQQLDPTWDTGWFNWRASTPRPGAPRMPSRPRRPPSSGTRPSRAITSSWRIPGNPGPPGGSPRGLLRSPTPRAGHRILRLLEPTRPIPGTRKSFRRPWPTSPTSPPWACAWRSARATWRLRPASPGPST
jgi:O-antigen ligase